MYKPQISAANAVEVSFLLTQPFDAVFLQELGLLSSWGFSVLQGFESFAFRKQNGKKAHLLFNGSVPEVTYITTALILLERTGPTTPPRSEEG